ncbi:hypothetical protein Q7P37_010980 [Cladosporium fusiforme]
MALPASTKPAQSAKAGQKRKREDSQDVVKETEHEDDVDAKPDANSLIPDDYEPNEDDGDDENDGDDVLGVIGDQAVNYPKHDEDNEPFPNCAYYDDAIEAVEETVVSISRRLQSRLSTQDCSSAAVKSHLSTAESLSNLPETKKIKIAILGGAGVGKSSLLNAVTGKPDLAKPLSGGQSCTCVPTEYQDAFVKQTLDFGALIWYLKPHQIESRLREMIKDYNTFAFQADPDWDEDTRTSAKKAYENALRMLRTLFNDLSKFKTKADTVRCLSESYQQSDSTLLNELVGSCEKKLKYTALQDYSEWHEASTVAKLSKIIEPLMTSTGSFEQPALWPLAREVSIGVRNSRVLKKVTLIDLPGISDTNQARVEITHDYIKTCDYVWVVAPISRVVDDGTVYQLLSRYGKAFNGMVSVICTHSDEGIVGSEQKLVNYFKQEDQDIKPFTLLTDKLKGKWSEINELAPKISAVRKRKKNTKQQMMDSQADEDRVKELKQNCSTLEAQRFEFLVKTRNSLITEQLQDCMQSHLPPGQRLEVHCVSSYHYAALKGASLSGSRLTANSTGVPGLRANTLALMAPRLLDTLAHYIHYSMQAMLNDLLLWINNATIDRRQELLALARQPQAILIAASERRRNAFNEDLAKLVTDSLNNSISDASQAALQQLEKKRKKHWKTIEAFIKNNGNHETRLCPKESWNENFSKSFAEAVAASQATLAQAQTLHTAKLQADAIDALTDFKKQFENFPALLPKAELSTAINTFIQGVRDAVESDAPEYAKDVRNVLFDITQDSAKNVFSRKMKPVYEECAADGGKGVIKRSMDTIEATLSKTGNDSPFAVAARRISAKLSDTDIKHMAKDVQPKILGILQRLHASVDLLLDDKVVDEAEVAAKKDLQGLLPILLSDWRQSDIKFGAIKARYAPGAGKPIVLD